MSHKNINDLRVIKTRKIIRQTFIEMLCEMDYDKITVQELAKRAVINRKTFYSHYDSLDDLLKEIQHETAQKFIERTRNMKRPRDIDKVTREFFLYSEALGRLGEKLNCCDTNLAQGIKDEIMTQMWDSQANNNSVHNIITAFVTQSTLAIYRQWVRDGRQILLDDIINITIELICRGVNNFKFTP